MKHFLLATVCGFAACTVCAETIAPQSIVTENAVGNPTTTTQVVYKKQTTVRYNAPVCDNCKTTTTVTKTKTAKDPYAKSHGCSTCDAINTNAANYEGGYQANNEQPVYAAVPPVVQRTAKSSCVFNNHDYAIANPLFTLKAGQLSTETVGGYYVNPRKKGKIVGHDSVTGEPLQEATPRWTNWQAAERLEYGITDWLSVHAEAGYLRQTPEDAYRKDSHVVNPTRYRSDTTGLIGLQAHAIDTCYFDAILGVDARYDSIKDQRKSSEHSINNVGFSPYAIIGGQIGIVTPYLQAAYTFNSKDEFDDVYSLVPGLYIQPNKYWAIHPYINKVEHEKPQWNLGFDFYPYKNLVFGIEGNGVALDNDPVDMFGISAHMKMVF